MLTNWERADIVAMRGRKKREAAIDALSEEEVKLVLKELLRAMHRLDPEEETE